MQNDESAQIHILEMLPLFWLFFMTDAFLITIHVPDEARLAELLATGRNDDACELVQNYLASGVEANCWLAKDSGTSQPNGEVATPGASTVNAHGLVAVDDHLWTISLDLWERGS